MRYSTVLAITAFALSTEACLSLSALTSLCGGLLGGGSSQPPSTGCTTCETAPPDPSTSTGSCGCQQSTCSSGASTCSSCGGTCGAAPAQQQAAASAAPPTDMFSQMIGGVSNVLEGTFSGSGAMLHNLIG
ncbi:hypothetical protein SBY92_000611 [Candida maltosa Xu316]|uniref:Uncharacterized protein n=1 Tax=Candida maltosa (strain Xu316) TaxID=1245528 RepID=M3K3A6_CANMX|nr:hypothetical protein G210_0077 [Candida maltosa Xu316]